MRIMPRRHSVENSENNACKGISGEYCQALHVLDSMQFFCQAGL